MDTQKRNNSCRFMVGRLALLPCLLFTLGLPLISMAQEEALLPVPTMHTPTWEYRLKLIRESQRRVLYPDDAWLEENRGDVVVRITLHKTGKLLDHRIIRKADYELFNPAAEDAIKRSVYAAFPPEITTDTAEFDITLKFAPPQISGDFDSGT